MSNGRVSRATNKQRWSFKREVDRRHHSEWARLLDERIADLGLRCWVASVIWWNTGKTNCRGMPRKGRLYELMNDCRHRDMVEDGRLERGLEMVGLTERPDNGSGYNSLLTAGELKEAERLLKGGMRQRAVARVFGVTGACIGRYKLAGLIDHPYIRKAKRRKDINAR